MDDFWEEEKRKARRSGHLDPAILRALHDEDPIQKTLKNWEREMSDLSAVVTAGTVGDLVRKLEGDQRLALSASNTPNTFSTGHELLQSYAALTIGDAATLTQRAAMDAMGAYNLSSIDKIALIATGAGAVGTPGEALKSSKFLDDQLHAIVGDLANGHDHLALRFGAVSTSAVIATALDDQVAQLTAGRDFSYKAIADARTLGSAWHAAEEYKALRLASAAEVETFTARASAEDFFIGRAFHDAAGIASLSARMREMDRAWLDKSDSMASVKAFARVQAVADVLREAPPFASAVGSWLRTAGFGDWRDPIDFSSSLGMAILEGRPDVYFRQGADEDIEETPLPVFAKSAEIGGLFEIQADWEEEWVIEPAVDAQLAQQAYARLRNFELALRKFIQNSLFLVNNKWQKQRLPPGMLEKWKEKKDVDQRINGKSDELISYADFTDYIGIIERNDNWNEVFQPIFRRKEDIRECMQRLYPLRLAAMHARNINAMDLHNVLHETRRMISVISGNT